MDSDFDNYIESIGFLNTDDIKMSFEDLNGNHYKVYNINLSSLSKNAE